MLPKSVRDHTEGLILAALILSGYLIAGYMIMMLEMGSAGNAVGGRVAPQIISLPAGQSCPS